MGGWWYWDSGSRAAKERSRLWRVWFTRTQNGQRDSRSVRQLPIFGRHTRTRFLVSWQWRELTCSRPANALVWKTKPIQKLLVKYNKVKLLVRIVDNVCIINCYGYVAWSACWSCWSCWSSQSLWGERSSQLKPSNLNYDFFVHGTSYIKVSLCYAHKEIMSYEISTKCIYNQSIMIRVKMKLVVVLPKFSHHLGH
jgi:hypothetical protein